VWYSGEMVALSTSVVVKDTPRGGCCLAEEVALASENAVVFLAPGGLTERIEVTDPIVAVWQDQFVVASGAQMLRVQVPTAKRFAGLFDPLWRAGQRTDALKLLTRDEFSQWWFHVLKLFPFLQFSKSIESPIKSEPDWDFDNQLNLEFAQILVRLNSESAQSVIAQLFAVSGTFNSFADLFDSHPELFKLVHKHVKLTKNPSYLEFVKFKKWDDLEFDLCESANDVVAYMKRSGITQDGLAWLFDSDPIVVYSLFEGQFRYEQLGIVRDYFPDFYLGVLGAVVAARSCSREQFLEYGDRLIAILTHFERSATKFCECMIKNSGETDQNIKYEIAGRVGKLLTMAESHGNHPRIDEFLRECYGTDLSVIMWATAEKYERVEAILEDWTGDDFAAFEWAVDRDPELFVRLLPTLKRKTNVSNERIIRFLETNPSFLASGVWESMDGGQPLSEIGERLEGLWASVQAGRARKVKLEEELAERRCQEVRLKMRRVDLTEETKCILCGRQVACGGNIYFCVPPTLGLPVHVH
jgi:hypothetical protein